MSAIAAKSATSVVATSRATRKVPALKPAVKSVPAVTTSRNVDMMVWQPVNNKQFETFSYLPPLTSDQIARQVDYIVGNGWIPCLEFSAPETAYVSNANTVRFGTVSCNYYDNRYWTMWKLPMFGCTDPGAVLTEVARCSKANPKAYVRLVAFDNIRQVQIMSFLVQRPFGAVDYTPVEKRSIA